MNLITDKWIPISDGTNRSKVAPWQLGELGKQGTYIDFTRPDFNLSATLFLIGVVQVLCKTANIHRNIGKDDFRKALDTIKDSFNLFGAGPIFMQDPSISAVCPIHTMFLDGTRKSTVKQNRDFFRKAGSINTMCPSCAAAGLYTLQTFAYKGGGGYFLAPLNNLFIFLNEGGSVWEKVWNNIFDPRDIEKYGNGSPVTCQSIFPWHTLSKEPRCFNNKTFPAEHVFWATPWKVLLHPEEKEGVCDCCGEHTKITVSTFSKAPKGIKYGNPKDSDDDVSVYHPLTAAIITKKGAITNVGASDTRTMHHQLFPIIYGLDNYKVNNPLKDGKVTISGTAMGSNVAYESWYEKTVAYNSSKKDLIKKMLDFEGSALDILKNCIIYSTNKYEAGNQVRASLEGSFYDSMSDVSTTTLEEWCLLVSKECLEKFNLYASRKFMVKILTKKLCNLLTKYSIDPSKLVIPKTAYVKTKARKLSKDTCTIILRWWKWLMVYNKTAKRKLAAAQSTKDLMVMEEYALSLYDKVVHSIFPDTTPGEDFSTRFAEITSIVLQLKDNSTVNIDSVIDKSRVLSGSFPERLMYLKDVVRKEKKLDLISIYNMMLYKL